MKKSLLLLFIIVSTLCFGQNSETTTIFLIRHAEKINDGTKDPALSKKGELRAIKWGSVLKSEYIDRIYSTNYKRTQSTAQAIAEANNISLIHSYNPSGFDFDKFLSDVKGKTVVIVGHSNTTPSFVNKLINEERYQQLEHSDFSKIFIIQYTSKDIANAIVLDIK